MGATLDALYALQEIELQIIDIRQQLARRTRAIAVEQSRLDQIQRMAHEQKEQLAKDQVETDALDLELKSRAAHVARLRTQLNSARTNKEYAGLLQELNTHKADETLIETGVMERLERIDEDKAAHAETEEKTAQIQARLKEAQNQFQRTEASLADRLAALNQQRKEAVAALDPRAARTFDRTSQRYDGEAMARIIRTNPRRDEFVCDGCHMAINLERFNAVVTRDDVQTCSSCGRILYVDVDG